MAVKRSAVFILNMESFLPPLLPVLLAFITALLVMLGGFVTLLKFELANSALSSCWAVLALRFGR